MNLPDEYINEQPEDETREQEEAVSNGEKLFDFFRAIVIALISAFLLKTFVIEAYRIPTGSMEKTLLVGDFLLVNKFIYGASSPRYFPMTTSPIPHFSLPAFRDPERTDIVVFEYPGDRDRLKSVEMVNYIKRCVGIPGDTIRIINKVLYVNGKEFYRPPKIQYVNPETKPPDEIEYRIFPKGMPWNEDNYGPVYVPHAGDTIRLDRHNIEQWRTIINREFDREAVAVDGSEIKIDGIITSFYVLQKDYYFMMGDNRDDSADSRFWGFVPRDKIIGKALLIYWSWDPAYSNILDLLRSVRIDRIARIIQ